MKRWISNNCFIALFFGLLLSGITLFPTKSYAQKTVLPSGPRNQMGTAVLDGKILFAGGSSNDGVSNAVDIYNTETGTWTTDTLSVARTAIAGAALGTKVMFAGGHDGSKKFNVVDIYDIETEEWSTDTLSQKKTFTAGAASGTKIMFAGGSPESTDRTSVVDIYDIETNKWTTADLSQSRSKIAAVSSEKKIFFAGGDTGIYGSDQFSSTVDIYNVETGQWSTASLSRGRADMAVATTDGLIAFGGGVYRSNSYNSNELVYSDDVDFYDLERDEWTVDTLSVERERLAAGSTKNKILFAGGINTVRRDEVDIYDTQTGEWSTTVLSESRNQLSGASSNNKIIFAGGHNGDENVDKVEIFDLTLSEAPSPVLASPESDAVVKDVFENEFTWDAIDEVNFKSVFHLSSQQDFSDTLLTQDIHTSSTKIDLDSLSIENNKTYYWRVQNRGTVLGDLTSDWLERSFEVSISPPTVVSPADQGVVEPPITISWESDLDLNNYDFTVHVSTQSDFSDTLQVESSISPTELTIDDQPLRNNTTYYWRVRTVSKNNTNLGSDWSESSFDLDITEPVLTAPGNEEVVTAPFEFTWEPESDPDNYNFNVLVSSHSNFSDTLHHKESVTITSFNSDEIFGLEENRPHYWKVQRNYIHTDSLVSDGAAHEFIIKPDFIILEKDSVFTKEPNYVNIMLHASDFNGEGITFLEDEEFVLSENGSPISPTESRYQVDRLERVESTLRTVMVLDNSQSIGSDNLELIKEAASEFIRNKSSNQQIAIYLFARNIEKIIDFTGDEQQLLDVINNIQLAELPGTDLYGAAIEGLRELRDDVFSIDFIEQNFMILFTDGRDISANHTLDDVIEERAFKKVFAIGIKANPDDFDEDALRDIGNAGTFIDPDFNNVLNQFTEVQQSLERDANSFYWLNYASATENENSSLVVEVKDNTNTFSDSFIEHHFDASDFWATGKEIRVNSTKENFRGVDSLTIAADDTIATKIYTVFSFEAQPFEFDISDPSKLTIEQDSLFSYTFIGNGLEGDTLEVIIRDTVFTEKKLEKKLIINSAVPEEVTVNASISFAEASAPQDYRLVALPGDVSESLANLLNGNAEVEWQAFWDDGSESDYLLRYDGSDSFTLTPGNGFWVTSQESIEYSDTLPMVSLNENNEAVIPLHPGWNIISNPLDIDVDWSAVEVTNDVALQPVWSFNGTFSEASIFASAKGGQAYYFLNDQGLDRLLIPYESTSKNKSQSSSGPVPVQLITEVDGEQTAVSSLVVTESEEEIEKPDVIAPPDGFEGASLRFAAKPDEDGYGRAHALATIFRAQQAEGQSHEMQLTASSGQPVTIRAEGSSVPAGTNLVLLDSQTGKKYELAAPEGVTLTPSNEQTDLLLLMGSSKYIEKQQAELLPEEIDVAPNYPNPFNPTTTLEFALPKQANVRVQVYNILGRRVSTLINNEVREAGVHKVTFDASRWSSGVYFAVFELSGQRFVQKMTLIK